MAEDAPAVEMAAAAPAPVDATPAVDGGVPASPVPDVPEESKDPNLLRDPTDTENKPGDTAVDANEHFSTGGNKLVTRDRADQHPTNSPQFL